MTDSVRRLVLLRHAKAASSDDAEGPDRDRPLAPRGEADAPVAGRWLREHGLLPDLVVCSPAVRARQTWELVSSGLGEGPGSVDVDVRFDERVYEASVRVLSEIVRETGDDVGTLLLLGHNPGVQGLAVSLAATDDGPALAQAYEDYPTAGIAVLEPRGDWSDLGPGGAALLDFTVPRA